MEAAEEVARQLRLRDLGGLIVIDFIDMRENKHNHEVEKTLKQALKMDKARVNLGRISEFGILEMSRQRIAKTLNDAIHLECPHCEGRGKVKSVEAMALSFLRKVHGAAAKGTVSEVHGGLPLEVAYYLLNRKKRELTQIENDYEIEVTVKGKTSFLLNQLELDTVKREIPRPEDQAKSEAEAEEAPAPRPRYVTVPAKAVVVEEVVEGAVPVEGGKKRKRRRKKKKGAGDAAAGSDLTETSIAAGEQIVHESEDISDTDDSEGTEEVSGEAAVDESAAKPKKRKRRRGRKGPKPAGDVIPESSPSAADTDTAIPEIVSAPEPVAAETLDVPQIAEKPKRPRPPRAKKKPAVEVAVAAEPPVTVVPVAVEESAPIPKPRRRAAAKKPVDVVSPPPDVVEEKKKPAPRARRKKTETVSE
jgi:ribonuclease E